MSVYSQGDASSRQAELTREATANVDGRQKERILSRSSGGMYSEETAIEAETTGVDILKGGLVREDGVEREASR